MSEGYSRVDSDLGATLYQEIVENARLATGARIVHLYRFDSERGQAIRVASSALTSPRIRQGLRQIQSLFPGFHPSQVHPFVTVNHLMRQVYLEGRPVRARVEDIAEGVVHPRILSLAKAIIGIGHVFSCPLISEGRVFAGLTFHHDQPVTKAQQATCEAFVRQVVLTMENAHILEESRHHVEELQRSRRLLTEAEETLRRKVAEFMHGRIQSSLLLVWHRLEEAKDLIEEDPRAAAALIEESREIIDRVREQDVRKASHLLHPSIIQVGLIPALRSLADTYHGHLQVGLQVDPRVREWDDPLRNRLPEHARLTAYRVVEEALSNTYRHGQASRADIAVRIDAECLQISVSDDGIGLQGETLHIGLGLGSIDARIAQLGGTWRLQRNVQRGATLTARIPIVGHESVSAKAQRLA